MRKTFFFTFIFFATAVAACVNHDAAPSLLSVSDVIKAKEPLAPVLKGLGDHQHPISTKNPDAQKFFNQGFNLLFGFYNSQAIRSFQEAARLDPDCAMCWWGIAYALGPNINMPMNPQFTGPALEAIARAKELAPKATEEEHDWINALAARYAADPKIPRRKLDEAYAQAMGALWKKYPNDLDAGTLYAEALMNTQPWNYWEADGKTPKGHGAEIVSTLEEIMKRDPGHPQALHLYIHALEASDYPEKAEFAADHLGKLMPGVGHIVHMPSHIYFRVGRYEEAVKVNELATKVDKDYIAASKAQGFYSPAFYGHNTYFMWSALIMLREEKKALEASREIVESVKEIHMDKTPGPMEPTLTTPLATMIAFRKWQEILDEPMPPKSLAFLYAYNIYARGLAHAHLKELAEAKKDRDILLEISLADFNQYGGFSGVAKKMISLELQMLGGEIARVSGNLPEAISHFEVAQIIEKSLPYMEPAVWLPPVAHTLGAALLQAGKPAEAEKVYRDSLQFYRLDRWALYGLYQSLAAQGKKEEAEKVKLQYEFDKLLSIKYLIDSKSVS